MTATEPTTAPLTRGWCHCAASTECHYLLDGRLLCGAPLAPVRGFAVALGKRKGDTAPKCAACDRTHTALWKNRGMKL